MEIRAGHATRMTSQFAMLAYPSKVLLSMSTATGKVINWLISRTDKRAISQTHINDQ